MRPAPSRFDNLLRLIWVSLLAGLALAAVLGLLAVDLPGGAWFALGAALSAALLLVPLLVPETFRGPLRSLEALKVSVVRRWKLLAALLALALLGGSISTLIIIAILPLAAENCAGFSRQMLVTPLDDGLRTLTITDTLVIEAAAAANTGFTPPEAWAPVKAAGAQSAYTLPARTITPRPHGFLVDEAIIPPPDWVFSDPAILTQNLAAYEGCNTGAVQVTLQDFPRAAFLAAENPAGPILVQPYLERETVSYISGAETVRFAFIRPPFQRARGLLSPFLGVSNLPDFLVALLGAVGGVLLSEIIKPALQRLLAGWRARHLPPAPVPAPAETARLVISPSGEEKEIEVKREKKQ